MKARWQAFTPRERQGLRVVGTLLGLLLLGSIAIVPALDTLRDSAQRRLHLDQQHAHMLALQAQAQTLQARTPLSRSEALRNLQGLTPNGAMQLTVQGERISVQLKGVPAANLAQWLSQARRQAQALPVEAHLTRSNAAGTATIAWDGTLVMRLPTQGANP